MLSLHAINSDIVVDTWSKCLCQMWRKSQ